MKLKYPESEYLSYDPDAGGKGDYWIKCQRMKIVKTRKPHKCMCGECNCKEFPAGTLMLNETAIVQDMGWQSCYFSIKCLDKWFDEWVEELI